METEKMLESVIPVKGIRRGYTFLHVTDLHASAFTDEEAERMPPERVDYISARRDGWTCGVQSAERLPDFPREAARVGADLVLMTGDMIDFPSEENIRLLHECVGQSDVPCLFTLGNHDWSFADDYHTAHAKETNIPRFADLGGGETRLHTVVYDDLIVAAVDDSRDYIEPETLDAFLKLEERADGRPIVVICHIPMRVDTLDGETVRVWRSNITIGPGALGRNDPSTMAFYREVAERADTPVALVVTGHLHFAHEDTLPNGVPQLLTPKAVDGACRIIRLVPAE